MTSLSRHDELNQHGDLAGHGDLSHHGDFDAEEAAMLQDLARDGAPEAQMYGYHDVGANGVHLNGYGDGVSNDMHSNGLSNGQQDLDLDDPASLLQSLINFEHPPPINNTPISNDHFASLLQAAAASAGGHEGTQVDSGRTRRSARHSRSDEQHGITQNYPPETRSKRRQDRTDVSQTHGFVRGTKRRKMVDEVEEQEQLAREREIWGPEDTEDEDDPMSEPRFEHTPIGTSDARAAGVHSAAALFRRPSSASKKYTRPPMSKLFTSLEVTPEQFIHLQAAAKNYMLDPDHPERRDCVGNRGRGDTDMVKLKLFGCVKSFLEDEGWGDKCFGPDADGADQRKLRWPQMKNKVISLVTPLLRRMVTNERQRQYAIETRKSNSSSQTAAKIVRKAQDPQYITPTRDRSQAPPRDMEPSSRYPDIDPKLDQYHYTPEASIPDATDNMTNVSAGPTPAPNHQRNSDSNGSAKAIRVTSPADGEVQYHLNIMHGGTRIREKLILSPSSCPALSSLIQHVHGALGDSSARPARIQFWGVTGLEDVEDEEAWEKAVRSVRDTEWMDGEVRVLVEVGYASDGD